MLTLLRDMLADVGAADENDDPWEITRPLAMMRELPKEPMRDAVRDAAPRVGVARAALPPFVTSFFVLCFLVVSVPQPARVATPACRSGQ